MPEISSADAAARAEVLREQVKMLRVPSEGRLINPIAVSAGVATDEGGAAGPEQLIQAADTGRRAPRRTTRLNGIVAAVRTERIAAPQPIRPMAPMACNPDPTTRSSLSNSLSTSMTRFQASSSTFATSRSPSPGAARSVRSKTTFGPP